jgi:hypothetical protein
VNRDIASEKRKKKEREALLKTGQIGESDLQSAETLKKLFFIVWCHHGHSTTDNKQQTSNNKQHRFSLIRTR